MRSKPRGLLEKVAAFTAVLAVVLLSGTTSASAEGVVLKPGNRGAIVKRLQEELALLGYLDGACDGVFGSATCNAVMAFQKAMGLSPDGIVGLETWSALSRELETRAGKAGSIPGRGRPPAGELLQWDQVDRVFRDRATVVDVKTGLSFRVRRRGGHNHADAEPLTSEDTAVMLMIYGGRWSWERRAVVVLIGNRTIAASMNGMPHGGQTITNNQFDGHFCIHFHGSRTHGTAQIDSEHQAMVMVAAGRR